MTSFYEELQKPDSLDLVEENAQSIKNIDKWIFRLFLLLLGFMPIVVLANVEEIISPLISNTEYLSSGMKGELFTHYKSLLTLMITVMISMLFLAKVIFMGGIIRKTRLNYVLGLFVIAIIFSTIASPNITIALNGQYNRSDGAISWLCYITLLFIATNVEYPKNVVRYVLYTMIPFVYVNFYIITMNFYGKDLLQETWVQKLVSIMLPAGASVAEGSVLIGTLNQWNYMSGMFSMMTVMYLAWAITTQKIVDRAVGLVTALVAASIMFMSISTSGFLTLIISFLFIIGILFKLDSKKYAITIIIAFLLLIIPIFHILNKENFKVWTESIGFFIKENPYEQNEISYLNFQNVAYASDNAFELPVLPERSLSAGTGRIYIWDKTLRLVRERSILGYGTDSFVYNFPHFNIDSRKGMLDENTIIDKPHNQFIGILYGTGILGFISIILLAFITLFKTFKIIISNKLELSAFALTVLSYFIQSMFNDSIPGITPIAFIMLGMLLTLFYQHQKGELIDGTKE